MIANVIVSATLVFGGIYTLVWCLKKDWRVRIEAPKLLFQQQLQAYDASVEDNLSPNHNAAPKNVHQHKQTTEANKGD